MPTKEEIIRMIKASKVTWFINEAGWIRAKSVLYSDLNSYACPIAALFDCSASHAFNISATIAAAADDPRHPFRTELEKACGLR